MALKRRVSHFARLLVVLVFGLGAASALRAELVAHWYLTEGVGTTFENLGEPTEGVPEDYNGYVAGAGNVSLNMVAKNMDRS